MSSSALQWLALPRFDSSMPTLFCPILSYSISGCSHTICGTGQDRTRHDTTRHSLWQVSSMDYIMTQVSSLDHILTQRVWDPRMSSTQQHTGSHTMLLQEPESSRHDSGSGSHTDSVVSSSAHIHTLCFNGADGVHHTIGSPETT